MARYDLLKRIFFGRYQKPWRWPEGVDPSAWERAEIPSRSGGRLALLYGPSLAAEAKSTVVCAHPMGTAAKGFFLARGHAEALRRAGHHVVLFDFNGFGESASGSFDYPLDVLDAGAYARARHPELPVHLLGASFGAAWSLCALSEPEHPFAAAVLECPFTTLEEYWHRHPVAYAALVVLSLVLPGLARRLRPIARVGDIAAGAQILLVYGADDEITPRSMGERFVARAGRGGGAQPRLRVHPGLGHTQALADPGVMSEALAFLDEARAHPAPRSTTQAVGAQRSTPQLDSSAQAGARSRIAPSEEAAAAGTARAGAHSGSGAVW